MAKDIFSGPALTQQDLNEIGAITRKFAREKKKHLISNLSALGLVKTGELIRSVRSGVRSSYGEAQAIWFKYKYYGLFHDKGADNVGRARVKLPARHWMASHLYGPDLDELTTELANYYGDVALRAIKITDVKA